jgi:hypothetical protein
MTNWPAASAAFLSGEVGASTLVLRDANVAANVRTASAVLSSL